MKEIEKLRIDFEKMRTKLVKLEGEGKKELMFENNKYFIQIIDFDLFITDKAQRKVFIFSKDSSFPLLVEAVDAARKRFEE